MRSRDPRIWMWAEACDLVEQAERLQRQFFVPARGLPKGPSWEPPVDVLETENELAIQAALPGVTADRLQVVIDGGTLIITGLRPMPGQSRTTMQRQQPSHHHHDDGQGRADHLPSLIGPVREPLVIGLILVVPPQPAGPREDARGRHQKQHRERPHHWTLVIQPYRSSARPY